MLGPRKERLSWADCHMLMASVAAMRSPDPNTQVGCILVDDKNRILSTGYNGFPRGINTDQFPWDRDKPDLQDNKYAYVVHAEANAVANMALSPEGRVEHLTCYVTMHPCNECAKTLIQAGVKQVIYLSDPYKGTPANIAASRMFDHLDIKVTQHLWNSNHYSLIQETLKQFQLKP